MALTPKAKKIIVWAIAIPVIGGLGWLGYATLIKPSMKKKETSSKGKRDSQPSQGGGGSTTQTAAESAQQATQGRGDGNTAVGGRPNAVKAGEGRG